MECPICSNELGKEVTDIAEHLLFIKTSKNCTHIHGPLEDKVFLEEAITNIRNHTCVGFDTIEKTPTKNLHPLLQKKEIVFHNRQRIGDIIMFTAGIRDFKAAYPDVRVNVISTAGHIWDNNPNIDRTLTPTEQNTIKIGPGKLTSASNRLDWHFANAFRMSIEDALGITIPQGKPWGDVWFTEEEFNAPPVTDKPYWIIIVGGEKGWGCKMYPIERWQKFIDQNPDTLFYQLGAREDKPAVLQGANVVNYIGKTQDKHTGIRDLFKLFLNAEGSIGLVSFHMHLSGALGKPSIVVAGAREPVSFTRYPGHRYLSTDGCLPCAANKACWHCDINTCEDLIIDETKTEILDRKMPKCVDIIQPEDITRALDMYYSGGRLKKGIRSPKPKFENIVKTVNPKTIIAVKPTISPEEKKQQVNDKLKAFRSQFGYEFNSGSIDYRDWDFINKIIDENKVKTVLEFGCGLSTLLMVQKGIDVISFETDKKWMDIVKGINPQCDVRLWDGKEITLPEIKFDLAFIDGPSGGPNREISTKIGCDYSDLLIIHDAFGRYEMLWQEKYVKPRFNGPIKGGHWNGSYLFQRKGTTTCNPTDIDFTKSSPSVATTEKLTHLTDDNAKWYLRDDATPRKKIKIVSTARGWGGCARSITTIMKYLLKGGHDVEFIPFRNKVSSREFKACIAQEEFKHLKVTEDYTTIGEPCDIFFMYADDYVWEFVKPEMADIFSKIHAEKKIMMLNYRRGRVGEIPWTMHWDKYMFLNSGQAKQFKEIYNSRIDQTTRTSAITKVLPPCVELDEFLKVNVDYSFPLRMVRHSSQGDTKFGDGFAEELFGILDTVPNSQMHLLPGPSFLTPELGRIIKYPRTDKPAVIANFLSQGNLFVYSLPQGYMDMGPRVILEAMAAGLPCIVDNWGGAPDRVTDECGWICYEGKKDYADIIRRLTPEILEQKGKAARQRALEVFRPEAWVKEILC